MEAFSSPEQRGVTEQIPGRAGVQTNCLMFLIFESEGIAMNYKNHLMASKIIPEAYGALVFNALKTPLLCMRSACENFYRLYEDEFWC